MAEKYAMILGAGLLQRPSILAAKELGLKTLVADANENALCVSDADVFVKIDLKDRENLAKCAAEFAKSHALSAVLTAGTDFSVSAAYVAQQCGLPSHSFESCLNATDKVRMRKCFAKSGVLSPKFVEIDDAAFERLKGISKAIRGNAALCAALQTDMNFPLVVKPCDSMGARGCRKVNTTKELIDACENALSFSRTRRAICEEFMDGPEFSIDALVFEKTMIICGFADRHINFSPFFVETGHTMPTEISLVDQMSVAISFKMACEALGLSCGACKGDIKLTRRGPEIGEIAARLSGGYMSGWTFPLSSGFDLTKAALQIACGQKPDLFCEQNLQSLIKVSPNLYIFPCRKTSAERAAISIPGKIRKIWGESEARAKSGVQDLFFRVREGDNVVFPQNNVEKCANAISVADSRDEACKIAEDAVKSLVFELECPNEKTEEFFASQEKFPPPAFALEEFTLEFLKNMSETHFIDTRRPIAEQMPAFLHPYLSGVSDWNGRSIGDTFALFDELAAPAQIPYVEFWQTLCRAGIQGALYLAQKYKTEK